MKINSTLKKNWHLITYATDDFKNQQKFVTTVHKERFTLHSYDDKWLRKTGFYQENKEILDEPTGGGWWAWKPFILLETIKKLDPGNFVIYCDCGDMFSPGIVKFVEDTIENDCCLLLLGNNPNKQYTKRDCFVLMNCDEPAYWNAPQLEAGFMIWRVCDETIEVLEEWLKSCLDFRIVSNSSSVLKEEFPDFISHRNDQSILTNIAVTRGLSVAGYDYRNFIECDYLYWYGKNKDYGFNLGREIDSFLLEIKNV